MDQFNPSSAHPWAIVRWTETFSGSPQIQIMGTSSEESEEILKYLETLFKRPTQP